VACVEVAVTRYGYPTCIGSGATAANAGFVTVAPALMD
jgi:hypothetical protein